MPLALSRTGVVFKKCYINDAGDFSRLARNVYKVLLTRGLRGCVIYPAGCLCRKSHPPTWEELLGLGGRMSWLLSRGPLAAA